MPNKPPTLRDYAGRVARVMAWLADHPGREPALEELAAIAAFSPCHFHRIYRLLAGETPAESLARARLQRAATALLQGPAPVAAVARQAGYGSAAALTRAFRAAYGLPPATYRRQGGIAAFRPPSHPTVQTETSMFEVTLRQQPPLHLAVLPHRGPYASIGERFATLGALAAGHGMEGPETGWFGLYHDDPETVPPALLRSAAGFTLAPGATPPAPATLHHVPATRVAALRFRGPYAELEPAYAWLYRDWLPGSGEEPADLPVMEQYLNDCRALPPAEWLTDILIPLK